MTHQIKGFGDDEVFIIINGILYKKEKYNMTNRYKYMLVKNIPYNERLLQEAYGLDDINNSLIINSQRVIDKIVKKSLNYTDYEYFDLVSPCKKNKKSKKKSLLSEKQIKKKKIKENKKNKNVLKLKQYKYKNNNLFYDYTDPNYWLSLYFNPDINYDCYHGYHDIGFPFVEYKIEDDNCFEYYHYDNYDDDGYDKNYYDLHERLDGY